MMKRNILIVAAVILSVHAAGAQKKAVVVAAADLYRAAAFFTGDSAAWPMLTALGERRMEINAFVLDVRVQKQLQDFAVQHKRVLQARRKLLLQITNGAKVFATDELDSIIAAFHVYDAGINEGSLEKTRQQASRIVLGSERIDRLIEENRNEEVDAKLAQKTGIVDKRKGYLGAWENAGLGDLFIANDGVRTGEKSLAQLFFTDGVDVTIDPSTIVIIRISQRDKLKQTIKRDIALVNGSLLTKLSPKAKETGDFAFQAGSSQSQIRSGKFWASTIRDRSAKVSNYDGVIDLSASNVSVTLQSNQGTVVEKGKPPLSPINLLPPPALSWERIDTVIYTDNIVLEWIKISGAVKYQIEASPSKDFDREIKRFTAAAPSFELSDIPLAATYVRMQAVDTYGLRGVDSPVYKILRTKNTQPPPIQIDGWETDRRYTMLENIAIHGKTNAGNRVTINEEAVKVDRTGSFVYNAAVKKPETRLDVKISDQAGNASHRTLSIAAMDTMHVFEIVWNCPVDKEIVHPAGETIEARGTAYPHVKVTAELGSQKSDVLTSPQGEWAVSLKPVKGEMLKLTFESLDDERLIGSKVWKVE